MVIRRAQAVVLVRIQVLGAIALPKGCIVSEVCNGSLTRHDVCSKTASTQPRQWPPSVKSRTAPINRLSEYRCSKSRIYRVFSTLASASFGSDYRKQQAHTIRNAIYESGWLVWMTVETETEIEIEIASESELRDCMGVHELAASTSSPPARA